MKPVNLNQLLFHPKSESLSFFLTPDTDFELFFGNMLTELQEGTELYKLAEGQRSKIMKTLKAHPDQCHGFFLSSGLQGYLVLSHLSEAYYVTGMSFHVRPLLEELYSNPEFMLVNVSLYDVKIFKGDFQNLEIIQHYEFDQLPTNFSEGSRFYTPQHLGLIPYKTILALKTISQKLKDYILYQSVPVIVTGLEEMKKIFLRYLDDTPGVFSHFQEDFYEKSCLEILGRCKQFRYSVMDFYSARLKDRLKRMMRSPRLISDLGEIIKATYSGKINHLVLPTEKKIWGKFDGVTGEFVIHKKIGKTSVDILNELAEEVVKQGGRIQILGPHFFPQDAMVLAILKGAL